MRNKKKDDESTEEAIARGITIQRFAEGKIPKKELKTRQQKDKNPINVKLLLSRCSPEQKEKLRKIMEVQGINIDKIKE